MYERPRLSALAGVSVIDLAALALASNLSGSGYYWPREGVSRINNLVILIVDCQVFV